MVKVGVQRCMSHIIARFSWMFYKSPFCLSVAFLLSLSMKKLMLIGAKLFYYITCLWHKFLLKFQCTFNENSYFLLPCCLGKWKTNQPTKKKKTQNKKQTKNPTNPQQGRSNCSKCVYCLYIKLLVHVVDKWAIYHKPNTKISILGYCSGEKLHYKYSWVFSKRENKGGFTF